MRIDDKTQQLEGSERIRYYNNSPDTLEYVWVQLDANIFAPDSDSVRASTAPGFSRVPYRSLKRMFARAVFDGSVKLTKVASGKKELEHVVVGTMMRIDLPEPLHPERSVVFGIDWNYAINAAKKVRGRTGYEHFPDDGNTLYEIVEMASDR